MDLEGVKLALEVVIGPAIGGLLVWLYKLDGRVHDLKAETATLKAEAKSDREAVNKIERHLSQAIDELRADLKEFRQDWREDVQTIFRQLNAISGGRRVSDDVDA